MPNSLCMAPFVLVCVFGAHGWSAGVPRSECFPIENARPELRQRFEAQLLAALDSEYLYTLVGGLKPMTDGGVRAPVGLMYRYPDLAGLRELQALLEIWTCGQDLYADVVVSWSDSPRQQDGEKYRTAKLLIVHRPAFERLIRRKQSVFGPYGFTGKSNPSVVYYAAWHAQDEGNRMLGYLYGFPDHAVEWYAAAVELNRMLGIPFREWVKENRNIWIPPFQATPGSYGFHYSVPKDHESNEEDSELQQHASVILNEYKALRSKYIGIGRAGVVAMMRDWYDDGTGRCAPTNVKLRLEDRSTDPRDRRAPQF